MLSKDINTEVGLTVILVNATSKCCGFARFRENYAAPQKSDNNLLKIKIGKNNLN